MRQGRGIPADMEHLESMAQVERMFEDLTETGAGGWALRVDER